MKFLKEMVKDIIDFSLTTLIVVFVCILVAGLFYLDYSAYKERFPNAAPWTYFFRK